MKEVISELIDIMIQEFGTRTDCRKKQVDEGCRMFCNSMKRLECTKIIGLRTKLDDLKNKVEGE